MFKFFDNIFHKNTCPDPEKEEDLSLGPWFLARDYPFTCMSYGVWKERREIAEFSVGNLVLSGHVPTKAEIAAIAANVSGRDSKPQDRSGIFAIMYSLASGDFTDGSRLSDANSWLSRLESAKKRFFDAGFWDLPEGVDRERCENEIVFYMDDERERLGKALMDYWAVAAPMRPWNLCFDTACALGEFYGRIVGAGRLDEIFLYRLFAREALFFERKYGQKKKDGIRLEWQNLALEKNMLENYRNYELEYISRYFDVIMEPVW